ncbi:hypothetical protein OB919_05100 [Halobacteria archaeon AArc-curdl1]|uniref:CHAT domain-containing protein n=1 Tax=Natronosalvus hydrolyticus TaxID=2979988 RepID=A0AAP3E628_9EURY|nr:hypothetical protein [Halobacteria archaeon AArc-curdl1]
MSNQFNHPEIRGQGANIDLWDPIERSSMGFTVPDPVSLEPVEPEAMAFPVDAAVEFQTAEIQCDGLHDVHVWTLNGDFVAESTNGDPLFLPPGEYIFDITGPIKTYFQVGTTLQVVSNEAETSIFFGGTNTVTLGVRSFHTHPAGEIPISDDPYSLLEAIPFLASSLKTLSPERSFPTFRGHPPQLVRTDDEDALENATTGLEKPDTDIYLEVPPDFQHLYPIAPLAFYLGADVLPSRTPQLRTPSKRTPFSSIDESYDSAVSQLLQRVFFLDCITRTEGYFQVPLHEREEFERALANHDAGPDALNFAALYDAPIAERIERYLEVPFEAFEHLLPEWRLTADVQPDADYLESLPFLVADLATIRCPDPTPVENVRETPQPLQDFFRDGSLEHPNMEFIDTPRADSLEQTFVGDSNPLDASKATLESFESRFDRSLKQPEDMEVVVVVNNEEMSAEGDIVSDAYRRFEDTGASVRFVEDVTSERLQSIFQTDLDFVHYIGHVDGRGLECADSYFDATDCGDYNVDAFILNSCQSYSQGEALVRGGCFGGVVTASPVLNEPAVEIGGTFARLLSDGFSLRAATNIATEERLIGNQYLVIGDGELRIVDGEDATPNVCSIMERDDGLYDIEIDTYPNNTLDMGCLFTPYIPGVNKRYLTSGRIQDITVNKSDLQNYLTMSDMPVKYDGELLWSSTLLERL